MIDFENLYKTVTKGLKDYVGCPVIRTNQNANPPAYPYLSYTVTTYQSENKGTYGVYEDGIDRKPTTQTWSITAQSDDNMECLKLINKAHEWLDHKGTTYLSDKGVIVQWVGTATNRDNLLTSEYEYKQGFDVVFDLMDEIGNSVEEIGVIEAVEIDGETVTPPVSVEELNDKLQTRLEGDS